MANLSSTLCWHCVNAVPTKEGDGCSWSRKLRPVPGWRAEKRLINYDTVQKESYLVHWCPQYRKDQRDGGVDG